MRSIQNAWVALGLVAGLGAGCYGLQAYSCTGDENCVDGVKRGVCEPSGFCSYPDERCDSGQRYDDLAGGGLAQTCVDAPFSTTTAGGGSSSTSSGGVDTSGDSSAGDASGDPSSTGESTCADLDGDGYGEGSACLGADCDDDNPDAAENCVYIAPDGDDQGTGDQDAPWRTFGHAVSMLVPGTSLVVLPGTYTQDVNERLIADCGDNAATGTPEAPIFVRASQERAAHIETGGDGNGVALTDCTDWRIRGLRISSTDRSDADSSSLVAIRRGQRIVLRRLLAHTTNRFFNSPAYFFSDCADTLIEESAAYDFSGTGFWMQDSIDTTVRRVYAHSRDREDLPDCTSPASPGVPGCTSYPARGDHGVNAGERTTIENTIVEHTEFGIVGTGVADAAVLGSAMLDCKHGVIFSVDNEGVGFTQGLRVQDVVAVGPGSYAAFMRSVQDATLRNMTAVGGIAALRADVINEITCPRGCAVSAANLLALGGDADGVIVLDENVGVVAHSNSFGSGALDFRPDSEPVDDDAGLFQNSMSVAVPRIGVDAEQCIAYVPDDSLMVGAGEAGADIGANIVFRTIDRALTDESLWDPETGAFPCGAVIEGVNDDPSTSCIGVHTRLHVASPGCPLPTR